MKKVLAALRDSPEQQLSRTDVQKLHKNNPTGEEVDELFRKVEQTGLARVVEIPTGGRPKAALQLIT